MRATNNMTPTRSVTSRFRTLLKSRDFDQSKSQVREATDAVHSAETHTSGGIVRVVSLGLIPSASVLSDEPTQVSKEATSASQNDAANENQKDQGSHQEKRRLITVTNNRTTLDVRQWPLIGDPDAKYIFVEMFDYTCPHCRATHNAVRGGWNGMGTISQLSPSRLPWTAIATVPLRKTILFIRTAAKFTPGRRSLARAAKAIRKFPLVAFSTATDRCRGATIRKSTGGRQGTGGRTRGEMHREVYRERHRALSRHGGRNGGLSSPNRP